MRAQMQDWLLVSTTIIDHAARFHGDRRILTRSAEGPVVTSNWAQIRDKARRVAAGLRKLGLQPGDRVGVMAWNTGRHLEVWHGVPGAGGVTHSLNPRLFDDQLIYIINHAEDRWLMMDHDLVPLIERLAPHLTTVQGFIVMTDRAHMPETSLPGALCYEDWVAEQSADEGWTPVDEGDACGICYTSGTTGNPKGVVYGHRSNVLHAMAVLQPDVLGLSANDVVMPVVPLFHANGWSTGYSTPMAGASMVMPGRDMTAPALYEMLEQGVTITLAVPTVWLALLQHLEETGQRLSTLKRVVIGGSACPRAVMEKFEKVYGVEVIHAWGMTETSPLGSFATPTPEILGLSDEEQMEARLRTGRPFYTVDLNVKTDDGADAPRDGETAGSLFIRGPGVVQRYLKADVEAADSDGWFDTGDVANMDAYGSIKITDRSKDVIKSGGEWISSIDLENFAVAHPSVSEAAAVGVPHPKWDERPVLLVVCTPGKPATKEEVLAQIAEHVAKWQVPDDVLFVEEIPHTATGKISKVSIRKMLEEQGYQLPSS
ncbi:MAG: long-chain fatty acid--CoA ligase [Pseudomonadota bacterium]